VSRYHVPAAALLLGVSPRHVRNVLSQYRAAGVFDPAHYTRRRAHPRRVRVLSDRDLAALERLLRRTIDRDEHGRPVPAFTTTDAATVLTAAACGRRSLTPARVRTLLSAHRDALPPARYRRGAGGRRVRVLGRTEIHVLADASG
jgi:hypothetical protein